MQRKFFLNFFVISIAAAAAIVLFGGLKSTERAVHAQEGATSGALQVLGLDGTPKAACPLKQTTVRADISGFLSRVTVTQEFENPFKETIEAVYTFPLPQNAAVDDMTMLVGDRTVRGKILRREDAAAVYEAAKNAGQVASLLDQERPNIFTQSVANILAGEKVKITISYVETLRYEDGSYQFVFPMVVGPRYNPGNATGSPARGNGFAADSDKVPDASRITPKPVAEGMRAGHDITIDVNIDAGTPVENINSKSHDVATDLTGASRAQVRLKNGPRIPNKDFVLRYDVAGKTISDALLTHRNNQGGFFTFIIQPPERVTVEDVTPKELVFVLDTSGSMNGFPIEKAKETMKLALNNLNPSDTFNLITFAGDTHILFPEPVTATADNLQKAQAFLETRSGSGGTEMMKAIKAALDPTDSQKHVRVVCFMTDGYVGNDMEIISEVQKHPNARVFAFGIGGSVNRFLLEQMAEHGRGEVDFVALNDDGSAAAKRFHERVRSPLLTDVKLEWQGVSVADTYPRRIPDLFSAKPVVVTGRYTAPGRGVVRLTGKMSGRDFVREIPVEFPDSMNQHDVLAPLWARARIEDLMSQDYSGAQQGSIKPDLQQTITNLGLEYRLMTQFTSFVAVEEMIVTDGGQTRRIDVPVEVPEGVNRATAYGEFGAGSTGLFANYSAGKLSTARNYSFVTKSGTNTSRSRSRAGTGAGIGAGKGTNTGGGPVQTGGGGPGGGGGGSKPKPEASPSKNPMAALAVDGVSSEEPQQVSKLHPQLSAVIERLSRRQALPGPDEATFVREGKANIQIWLVDKKPETLAKLKELGFEIVLDPKSSKMVIGRLPVEQLAKLKDLVFVRYVAPQKLM